MKSRIIPVILTAAATSVATLFVAGKFDSNKPYFSVHDTPAASNVRYASNDNMSTARLGSADFTPAAESAVKAVVHIKTQIKARAVAADDIWGQLFGQQYMLPPQMGSGSGVVISPDGYIVTNNHVVANADQVTVTFNDRYTTSAKVISADPATDIAVIKVNEKNLSYMDFGNSDNVRLGQWVLAVGYPLSLDATVTAGIVSAKGRSIGINRTQSPGAIESFIQTDAAVNPGNSGGALVNTDGQLIGINSAIASPTGSYAGYSYAIPSNIVRKVVNDMVQYGSVQRGYLGIRYLDRKNASPEQLSALGLDRTDGVYVEDVVNGSGAADAGLKKGDFITAINSKPVTTAPELQEQVARYHPGDNISVAYLRNGSVHTTTIELKKDVANPVILGANLRPLTNEEKKKLGVENGVLVTNVGNGILAQAGIKNNFIIISVNDYAVKTSQDLEKLLSSQQKAQIAGIYPGYRGMYYYGINANGNSESPE